MSQETSASGYVVDVCPLCLNGERYEEWGECLLCEGVGYYAYEDEWRQKPDIYYHLANRASGLGYDTKLVEQFEHRKRVECPL